MDKGLSKIAADLNPTMRGLEKILEVLATYHSYDIKGLEHIPRSGPCLLVTHHSLATYDGFILGMRIFHETGRLVRGLGDDLLFKVPFIRERVSDLGIVPAGPKNAKKLLDEGELLGLAPGGMREALRPKDEKYRVYWRKRFGFARLAIETQVPIVLAACPLADDIYDVYPTPLTSFLYRKFKFPLPVARGLGPSMLPRPVKLTHYVQRPLIPPRLEKGDDKKMVVQEFHRQVMLSMSELLKRRD